MPRVSVIMGAYNCANRITKAVDSILNQTFDDFELIICNDCSKDNTKEILEKLKEKDSRIIIVENPVNSGLSASLNRCIENASGEYIARMDDDDISHPERFAVQVKFLDEHPEYAMVGCKRNTFDEKGIWNVCGHTGELTKEDIISGRFFTHPTVIIRKEALVISGLYTVSKRTIRSQDFDLWCKMYYCGYKGYVLEDVLFDYYEDRNKLKTVKAKFRINDYKSHKIWRKKLKLPLKYDKYAYKHLLAIIIPNKILIKRKNRIYKNTGEQNEK